MKVFKLLEFERRCGGNGKELLRKDDVGGNIPLMGSGFGGKHFGGQRFWETGYSTTVWAVAWRREAAPRGVQGQRRGRSCGNGVVRLPASQLRFGVKTWCVGAISGLGDLVCVWKK